MIKKAKVYQIQNDREVSPPSEDLSGIPLLRYLFRDFFKISCLLLFIYVDAILLAYPFAFLPQYETIGTIFGVFENYTSPGSFIYIAIALFSEVILIILQYKLFRKLWPKKSNQV